MDTGRSIPNQTAAMRLGVNPRNQVLVFSLVVPVFPAAGTSKGSPARARMPVYPVPRATTSSSSETDSRATSGSSTCVPLGARFPQGLPVHVVHPEDGKRPDAGAQRGKGRVGFRHLEGDDLCGPDGRGRDPFDLGANP